MAEDDELNLREYIKADYSEQSEADPMEGSFRAVSSNPHNLTNVSSLRDKYPLEYAERMKNSAVRPEVPEGRRLDPGWFTGTLAARVLKGVLDSEEIDTVREHFDSDMLGIPPEFIAMEEVGEYITKLADRTWQNQEIADYVLGKLAIQRAQSEHEIKQTTINVTPFR